MTRRSLVALAAAVPAAAQQAAAPPPIPATPDEELNAVRALNRANAEQLAKVTVPIGAEPATHFKS